MQCVHRIFDILNPFFHTFVLFSFAASIHQERYQSATPVVSSLLNYSHVTRKLTALSSASIHIPQRSQFFSFPFFLLLISLFLLRCFQMSCMILKKKLSFLFIYFSFNLSVVKYLSFLPLFFLFFFFFSLSHEQRFTCSRNIYMTICTDVFFLWSHFYFNHFKQ